MAFMDKLKDVASKAAEKASSVKDSTMEGLNKMKESTMDGINKAKESYAQQKAEKEAYEAQLEAEAKEWTENMINQIIDAFDSDRPSLFCDTDTATLDKFTKNYYEMMVLPGSRPNISCLTMNPYIDDKAVKKLTKHFAAFDGSEAPFIYVKETFGQEIVITKTTLLFRLRHGEKNLWCEGQIPVASINTFDIVPGEGFGYVTINGVQLSEIKYNGSYKQDFISLGNYFECIRNQDFEISNEEVDALIRKKIGDKIYAQVQKYFADEDEKILFYAGGIDSVTAVDYIACTTSQIIVVNREMMGATANVKQFYYEDVTAMATIQNTQSNDLLVAALDTALTAALKICTLQISVAGAKENINTIYLTEGTRIVAIYHEARKNAKKANAQPTQTIVQQAAQPDALEQLEKLAKLKDAGIISEEEFAQKKADLLSKL
ncbi:MAG: SHOCT domain-containing protein [Lachnospiraceae bacterium]|nr:SHOCT domain-containing protein [Lachnospiraceae bacterium]